MLRDEAGRWAWPALGLVVIALALTLFLPRRAPLASLPMAHAAPRPGNSLPLRGVTLILDPGHGGADSGAVRHGVCEAALTYRTAVEVAEDVRRAGGRVLFTVRSRALNPSLAHTEPPPVLPRDAVLAATGTPLRERDSPRPLWLRAAVARRVWGRCAVSRPSKEAVAAPSLFFLSLHYDDYHQESIHGALVCVDRRMASVPSFARVLAASLCAAGLTRSDTWHGLRGVAASHLGVLDPYYNPIPQRALLEVATISNADDAQRAADPEWRHAMAARITLALIVAHEQNASEPRPAVQ